VPLSITLLRHARSEANDANVWSGQGDAPLSEAGRAQARLVAERLRQRSFDLVVSSDLQRARDTVTASGHAIETDSRLREIDLGEWEGRSFDDVAKDHPDLLAAIRAGEAVRPGVSGESMQEFEERAWDAVLSIARDVGEGSVLISTHGGFIDAVVGRLIGRTGRRTYPIATNSSLTEIRLSSIGDEEPRFRLQTFNDATHLGWDHGFLGRMRSEGKPVIGMVRHGVTVANRERRIQGQTCWGLAPEGFDQAAALAAHYGHVDEVWASPIRRATETAGAFAAPAIRFDDDLKEMSFGTWEGLLYDDLIASSDPDVRRVFHDLEDLPRGGAERFVDVSARMRAFLERSASGTGRRVVAVSHGAAIKSLLADIHGRGNDINLDVSVSRNTGVSHFVVTDQGPWLADWSVAPHLEDAAVHSA